MIVTASFKTPDVLDYVLKHEPDAEGIEEKLSKWIKYGECITIEFDTEAMTAKVLEV